VGAVDRVPRLEADHGSPASLCERGPRLSGREPVREEVVVLGQAERANRACEAEVARLVERRHARVLELLGPIDTERLLLTIALEDLGDVDDRDRVAPLPRQKGHRVPGADPLHIVVGEGQRDRDRPGQAAGQVHRLQDGEVVGLADEPRQRGQGPHGEHLQVGELPGVHHQLGEVVRLGSGCFPPILGHEQVDEVATVRSDRRVVGHGASTFRRDERPPG
jgi:hypothetical protein